MHSPRFSCVASLLAATILLPVSVSAAPFVVPKAALQPPQVTFSELPNNTFINGQTINGFTFSETVSTLRTGPSAPPGNTNNLDGQIARSIIGSGYVLNVAFANPVTAFGFGFWVSLITPVPNAVTVTLFDGATNLGSLVFSGNPDPTLAGGYVGIGNAIAFTSARLAFSSDPEEIAVDNFSAIRATTATPEGGSSLLFAAISVLALIFFFRQTKRSLRTTAGG